MFGKDWNKVQEHITTRTSAQTRSHAQKYFNKLCKRGNMRELALYDAILSNKRRGMELDIEYDEDGSESRDWPMGKTKIIGKNYPFRLIRPFRSRVSALVLKDPIHMRI